MKEFIYTMLIVLIVLCSNVYTANKNYGDICYAAYVKNYDGDTITFNIPNIHPLFGKLISVRLSGVDTPEIRGSKCAKEKELAYKAKVFVKNLLTGAEKIELKNVGRGKYFRILADIHVDGINLAELLIKNNFAIRYYGGKKEKDWCNGN